MLVGQSANQGKDKSVLNNQKPITTRLFENPGLATLDLSMTIEKLFFEDFFRISGK